MGMAGVRLYVVAGNGTCPVRTPMTHHKQLAWALSLLAWSSMLGVLILLDFFTDITARKITIVTLMLVVYISGYIEGLCKGYFVP
jgi:hypothetical protein